MIEFTSSLIKFFELNFPSKKFLIECLDNKEKIKTNFLMYKFYNNEEINIFKDLSKKEKEIIELYKSKNILEGEIISKIRNKKEYFLKSLNKLSKLIKDDRLLKVLKEYYFENKGNSLDEEIKYLNKIFEIGKEYMNSINDLKIIVGFLIFYDYSKKFTKLLKYYYMREIEKEKLKYFFEKIKWPY